MEAQKIIRKLDWRILMLAVVALGCFSCSTPPVPDEDRESYSGSSYDSYLSCVRVMVQYGREAECDRIRTADGRGYSYEAYNGVNYNYDGKAQLSSAQLSKTDKDAAYAAYLSQLDASSSAELKQRWSELAQSVNANQN